MKKIKLVLLLIGISIFNLFSQEVFNASQRELYLQRLNFPVYPPLFSVDNYLNALTPIWDRDINNNNFTSICTQCLTTTSVTINNDPRIGYGIPSNGWNFCTDDGEIYPYYGYALYKMSNSKTNNYFYLDFRDGNYGIADNVGYELTDVKINLNNNYDGNGNSRYEYKIWQDESGGLYMPISDGDVIRVWEIPQVGPSQPYIPETGCFPNFWQNSLAITQTANNNPRLVWGPHPTFSTTYYKVYRAVSNTEVSDPSTLTYQLIYTSPNASTFSFTDDDIMIGSGQYFYYYVTANRVRTPKPILESDRSNYTSIRGGIYKKGNGEEEQLDQNFSFSLNQNYPNPFNPSTLISYQLAANSFVTLKVFDVLGNEVAVLVNEWKEAGSYTAQFTTSSARGGKQFASGMYFYTLTAGKFTGTKKFILMK